MEVKEKTDKQTVKTYVACDGREFDTKFACMNYERQIEADEARKRTEKLPNFEMSPPFAQKGEVWRWFYVNSQKNVDDIAVSLFERDNIAYEFRPKSFPCWVAAVRTDDRCAIGEGWMMTHSEYADKIAEFDNALEDELTKKNPEERRTYSEGFENFWSAYPRRTGKSAAFDAYQHRLREGYSDEALFGAAANYAQDCHKKKMPRTLVMYASSFLGRQGAYADYLPGFYRSGEEGETT